MILDAIGSHPLGSKGVTMVATDGVYFRTEHGGLNVDGSRLGAWDEGKKTNMCQFMPGVYWDDALRNAGEKEMKEGMIGGKMPGKTRGVNVRDLAGVLFELDSAFEMLGEGGPWPQMTIPRRFDIVSCGQALAWKKWYMAGRVHGPEHNALCSDDCRKGSKTLSANPVKKRVGGGGGRGAEGVVRSGVYRMGRTLETTPYDKSFGMELDELRMLADVVTDEGMGMYDTWLNGKR
jgi:hypothetical protein